MTLPSRLRSTRSLFVPPGNPVGPGRRIRQRSASAVLTVEALEDRIVRSAFTVLNLADSGAGSLRQAVLDANANPGADVIRFAPGTRDGTIALSSGHLGITDALHIDGPGAHRLAVSGNDVSRIFHVGGGVSASIDALTITHGRALGQGGGILNAGTLTLTDAILSENRASGIAGVSLGTVVDAFGGGIFNTGTLTVRSSRFMHNESIGADGTASSIGSSALGGAIMSGGTTAAPASASVIDCSFVGNQAAGGSAGIGASRAGIGGAIQNATGTLTVSYSLFRENQAVGGLENGVPGGFGAGSGGAIGNVARAGDAILSVSHCIFSDNRAVGGATGAGVVAQDGRGGAIASFLFGGLPQPVTVRAIARVDHSALYSNQAIGGAGTTGGSGQGGGMANLLGGVLSVSDSLIAGNRAVGGEGDGRGGGNGHGGGIFNGGPSSVGTPSLTLLRALVTLNRAEGGAAASGGSGGLGQGGGLFIAPGALATADPATLIFANEASTSDDDVYGFLI